MAKLKRKDEKEEKEKKKLDFKPLFLYKTTYVSHCTDKQEGKQEKREKKVFCRRRRRAPHAVIEEYSVNLLPSPSHGLKSSAEVRRKMA